MQNLLQTAAEFLGAAPSNNISQFVQPKFTNRAQHSTSTNSKATENETTQNQPMYRRDELKSSSYVAQRENDEVMPNFMRKQDPYWTTPNRSQNAPIGSKDPNRYNFLTNMQPPYQDPSQSNIEQQRQFMQLHPQQLEDNSIHLSATRNPTHSISAAQCKTRAQKFTDTSHPQNLVNITSPNVWNAVGMPHGTATPHTNLGPMTMPLLPIQQPTQYTFALPPMSKMDYQNPHMMHQSQLQEFYPTSSSIMSPMRFMGPNVCMPGNPYYLNNSPPPPTTPMTFFQHPHANNGHNPTIARSHSVDAIPLPRQEAWHESVSSTKRRNNPYEQTIKNTHPKPIQSFSEETVKLKDIGDITLAYFRDLVCFSGRGGAILLFLLGEQIDHKFVEFGYDESWLHVKQKFQDGDSSILDVKGVQDTINHQGFLPVVAHAGRVLCETTAILRYLAKKVGQYGSNHFSDYFADMMMDKLEYWRDELMTCIQLEVLSAQEDCIGSDTQSERSDRKTVGRRRTSNATYDESITSRTEAITRYCEARKIHYELFEKILRHYAKVRAKHSRQDDTRGIASHIRCRSGVYPDNAIERYIGLDGNENAYGHRNLNRPYDRRESNNDSGSSLFERTFGKAVWSDYTLYSCIYDDIRLMERIWKRSEANAGQGTSGKGGQVQTQATANQSTIDETSFRDENLKGGNSSPVAKWKNPKLAKSRSLSHENIDDTFCLLGRKICNKKGDQVDKYQMKRYKTTANHNEITISDTDSNPFEQEAHDDDDVADEGNRTTQTMSSRSNHFSHEQKILSTEFGDASNRMKSDNLADKSTKYKTLGLSKECAEGLIEKYPMLNSLYITLSTTYPRIRQWKERNDFLADSDFLVSHETSHSSVSQVSCSDSPSPTEDESNFPSPHHNFKNKKRGFMGVEEVRQFPPNIHNPRPPPQPTPHDYPNRDQKGPPYDLLSRQHHNSKNIRNNPPAKTTPRSSHFELQMPPPNSGAIPTFAYGPTMVPFTPCSFQHGTIPSNFPVSGMRIPSNFPVSGMGNVGMEPHQSPLAFYGGGNCAIPMHQEGQQSLVGMGQIHFNNAGQMYGPMINASPADCQNNIFSQYNNGLMSVMSSPLIPVENSHEAADTVYRGYDKGKMQYHASLGEIPDPDASQNSRSADFYRFEENATSTRRKVSDDDTQRKYDRQLSQRDKFQHLQNRKVESISGASFVASIQRPYTQDNQRNIS